MNIPPEVKVNGKWRPTRNSLGKLIHPTPEGLVAFWKWFGDSQVVDEQGRPLVVYHGTDSDWSVYDFSKKRKSNAGNPTGIYVTVRGEADAASYASTRVLSLYAKAEQPYFLRGGNRINAAFIAEYSKHLAAENSHIDSRWVGSKVEALRAEGKMPYTGMSSDAQRLVLLAGGFDSVQDGPHWAVLESTQIKSAIGNRGTFDPSDPVMTNPPDVMGDKEAAALRKALRQVFMADKAFALIDQNKRLAGCDWSEGACRVAAEALHAVLPGSRLAGVWSDRGLEHVVVHYRGRYIDGEGVWTREQIIQRTMRGAQGIHGWGIGHFDTKAASKAHILTSDKIVQGLIALLKKTALTAVQANPLVTLPPDFFPKAAENLRQQRAIRDDIYAKVGIWWDDLDAMMDELHRLHAEYKRRQFKVIKRNPRRRRRK